MPTFRATASTLAASIALGAGSLTIAAPAHAEVPDSAPAASQGESSTTTTSTTRTSTTSTTSTTTRADGSISYGNRSEAIRRLQRSLTKAGFTVPATGYFGPITRGALRDFQASQGLRVTGRASAATLRALAGDAGDDRGSRVTSSSTVRQFASSSTTSSSSSSSTSSSSAAQAAVAFAYAQLGTPYVYGGTGGGGYDCSGLTQAAWRAAGVSIPRVAAAQWAGLRAVSTSDLQPGDLVVFYGGSHIGIYVGDGMVIHAPRPGKVVQKVPMSVMPVSGAVRPA